MRRPTYVVRSALIGAGIVYSVLLYLSGVELDSWTIRVLAILPPLGAGLLMLWDVYLWWQPGFQRLTRRPRIDGLWEVTLRPTEASHISVGGNRGRLKAYVIVSQTFWTAHIRQVTAESSGRSRAFFWERDGDANVDTLAFVYCNEPSPAVEHRSPMHLGTCRIDVTSLQPKHMSGVYFTDRYTKGDLELRLIDRSRGHATFRSAAEYAASVGN